MNISDQFKLFLKILGKIESNNNPNAFNKKENAIGIYQIRPLYFKDAQKFDPRLKKYNHWHCFNLWVSQVAVISYLTHYCKTFTLEEMARIHNGGPNGYKKASTLKYWKKFVSLI